jgi:hypothetical protein
MELSKENRVADMSDTPTAPEWWQASDGRWYPPPHPAAPAAPAGGTATATTVAPAAHRSGSWLMIVALGAVLVVAGVVITYLALNSSVGPAGYCGTGPGGLEGSCDQLRNLSMKAVLTGGGLGVVGLVTVGIGFVVRSRSQS